MSCANVRLRVPLEGRKVLEVREEDVVVRVQLTVE